MGRAAEAARNLRRLRAQGKGQSLKENGSRNGQSLKEMAQRNGQSPGCVRRGASCLISCAEVERLLWRAPVRQRRRRPLQSARFRRPPPARRGCRRAGDPAQPRPTHGPARVRPARKIPLVRGDFSEAAVANRRPLFPRAAERRRTGHSPAVRQGRPPCRRRTPRRPAGPQSGLAGRPPGASGRCVQRAQANSSASGWCLGESALGELEVTSSEAVASPRHGEARLAKSTSHHADEADPSRRLG